MWLFYQALLLSNHFYLARWKTDKQIYVIFIHSVVKTWKYTLRQKTDWVLTEDKETNDILWRQQSALGLIGTAVIHISTFKFVDMPKESLNRWLFINLFV